MQKLKKIDTQTNILTWFEIPVSDLNRAKLFYETILDIEMTLRIDGENEGAFFPYNPKVMQATSGRVTGVLSKSNRNSPSSNGTMVYINASPEIQLVLDKVEIAGGKIVVPKTGLPFGFIAVIIDSEGNRIGLHAEK
ncbi:MAG: VOC family protein [Paludibacter sp.]|nr:VOC family protein [Paludibacter sp.]